MSAETPTSPASCAAAYHAADTAPSATLRLGDCMEVMRGIADNTFDSIVTDPPYGLNFMGKDFDNPKAMTDESGSDMEKFQKYLTPIFKEMLRVAKPGAHLLAFGGTRTFHRLACAIEDAGWECRDTIMYCFGSGFPKGMDVGKAIDKLKGAKRTEVVGTRHRNVKPYDDGNGWNSNNTTGDYQYTAPATPEAEMWDGWNSVLKPAFEPIIMARKPLEGTIAENVLKWGTGAININGCRVPTEDHIFTHEDGAEVKRYVYDGNYKLQKPVQHDSQKLGRYPANLIHDGSDEVLALFPDNVKGGTWQRTDKARPFNNNGAATNCVCTGKDTSVGSAARFFYCAKASRSERNKNCERLLTWEQNQELTQLTEKSSQLLKDISESMMQTLDAIVCNMTSFGNDNTVQSQAECKSIISTASKLITALKTSLSSPRSTTSGVILDAIKTSEESGINVAQLAEKLSLLKQDSTSGETAIAMNAVNALFAVLSEIRNRARLGNHHCTIKPIALMRYLVRLVTRKGGVVLDPFMGSGTTGVAAKLEGMRFFGCEKEPTYFEIAKRRVYGAGEEFESEEAKPEEPAQSDSAQVESSEPVTRQMEFNL